MLGCLEKHELMVMLSNDDGQIFCEGDVKFVADRGVMAEIGELPIDAANELDIIVLYIFQIFLL